MPYTPVNKSTSYFNTKLWTGNGGTNALTGVGFQPDMTWLKKRNGTTWHNLYDAVRGVTKAIVPNEPDAEGTRSTGLTAFGTDGFTVGADNNANANNDTYVGWNWKANGAGSANTDGSINTTATSANTTSGFSIVKYTGTGANATVGHGLGAVPTMILTKNLDQGSEGWLVYHVGMGNGSAVNLNSNGQPNSSASYWNNTTPTSSVFSVGTNHGCNGPSHNMIAYCFADKTGYCKSGSYEANNAANGPFIYLGFKPRFILMKSIDVSSREWFLIDNKRSASGGGNVNSTNLVASTDSAEWNNDSWGAMDLLSNGFKIRTNDANKNSSGTYIYTAIGQSLVGSNNVTATAR